MNQDKLSQLERLSALYNQGLLSESEFEQQKNALLNSTQPDTFQPVRRSYKESDPKSAGRRYLILVIIGGLLLLMFYLAGGGFDTPTPESEKPRSKKLERLFSAYDGSHGELEEKIKSLMNNPNSYEHLETRYRDDGNTLFVVTKFRGKNGFGGTFTQTAQAIISSSDGHIIKWKMQ